METAQDYVEAIADVTAAHGEARAVDLARRLGLSRRTVQRQMQQLMRRLGADSRFQAGLQAKARGWL